MYFVSNNSTKNRSLYVKKLLDMGIECEPHEILSSSFAAGAYCAHMGVTKAFVVGEVGFDHVLQSQ